MLAKRAIISAAMAACVAAFSWAQGGKSSSKATSTEASAMATAALPAGAMASRAMQGGAAGAGEAAQSGAITLPKLHPQVTKLANGLEVVLVVDRAAPVYSIDVCYNVGSRNERPGRTGFAHLFEHMMFQGSKNIGKGEHMLLVMNNGGGMNGTTNEDRTTYFEELPKNQLALGLFLESDRMRSLNINPANLENQRNAVEEERRQGIDNEPYGRASLDIDRLAYHNFAYSHPVIGSMNDLNRASLQDVSSFFRTYYAPDNAVLTLVGDFDAAAALAEVKKYFGSIPAQPAPPAVDLAEQPQYGERTETIYDPLARMPEVDIAYHIPAGDTAGNYAAQELALILGQGESSRLYRELVEKKQLASEVEAFADERIGPSLLYISANPRPGVTAAELQKGIDDEISRVVKDGITAAELEKAKTQLLRRAIEQRRSSLYTAILIGDYTVKFHDPNLIDTMLSKEDAVTLEQVNAAAKNDLQTSQRVVVITLPGANSSQAVTAGGGARQGNKSVPLSQVVKLDRAPVNSQVLNVKLPRPKVVKLANGLTLVMLENHQLPTIAFRMWIRPGQLADPADLPGVASFTAGMLREGTDHRSSEQIAEQVDAIGGSLNASSPFGSSYTTVSASGLINTAPQLLDLMSDEVLHPAFPTDELAKFKQRQLADLQQNLSQPGFLASRAYHRAIFGDTPPGTISPTKDSIGKITADDLKKFHDQHFVPGNTVLGVTGDFDSAAMQSLIEKYFGEWTGAAEPAVTVPENPAPDQSQVVLVDRPGSVQTFIVAADRGISRTDPNYETLELLNHVVGEGPQSRLFMDLREVHGYTYGAYSRFSADTYPGYWAAFAPVRTPVTGGSMDRMVYELKRIDDEPTPAPELDAAKRSIVASFALSLEQPSEVLSDWLTVVYYGMPMDYWDSYPKRIEEVSAEAVKAAAQRYANLAHMQWVCVGDRKQIESVLAKYGPVKVVDENGQPEN
jgi:zinc protease